MVTDLHSEKMQTYLVNIVQMLLLATPVIWYYIINNNLISATCDGDTENNNFKNWLNLQIPCAHANDDSFK